MKPYPFVVLVALVALVGCAPAPKTAPEPVRVLTMLSPSQAVQRAALRLSAEGFVVVTSDAAAGVLTAALTRTGPGDYGTLLTCRYGPDAIGRQGMTTVLTARVATAPSADGTSVVIGTSTMTSYGAQSAAVRLGSSEASTSDCASTGEIEKRLAAALSTP